MSGRLLGGNFAAPPPPQLVVATPLNDAQLVSLVAAQVVAGLGLGCDPKTAVERATEIVAEAVIQTANLPALVRAKQKAREVT